MSAAPAAPPASVRELLTAATATLERGSDSPRLDAEVLLCHALGWPRSRLMARPEALPGDAQRQRFTQLLEQRKIGVPVAHLTGRREFWSLELAVTPATLIPRPDTELLVELALERLPAGSRGWCADLGTGCGAIALALAGERPGLDVIASDLSVAALAVAAANVRDHGLGNVRLLRGDWCRPLARGAFRLIVSNPPYVEAGDPHLAQGDVRFEPPSALVAGRDGLGDLRQLADQARACLEPGGTLLLEHGYRQAPAVAGLLAAAGYRDIEGHRDLAGRPRVSSARRAC